MNKTIGLVEKEKILKRLHNLLMLIVKANDNELDKIGTELLEIEKKIVEYDTSKKIKN